MGIKELKIDQWERVMLDSIFTTHPFTITEIEIAYFAFNKSFDDLIRHLEYAQKFAIAATEPISLTEEWLLRFGFGFEGEAPGRIKLDCDYGEVMIYPRSVKYVHTFQNLYFALTGQELTIKQ